MKLTTHLHLELILDICGAIPPLPNCLHDMHRNKSISIFPPVKHSDRTTSNTKTN